MKRIISLLIIVILCFSMLSSCMPNLKKYIIEYASTKTEITEEIYEDEEFVSFLNKMNSFALEMTSSIANSSASNDNYCISPVSIYMSLAIACECSNGQTKQEILDALGITYEQMKEYTKYYYALYNKEYTYVDSYGTIHTSAHEQLANSLWLNSNVVYNQGCINTLTHDYNCDTFSISYADGTAGKIINQYIEYKSHSIAKGDVKLSKSTDFSIISLYHLKEIWNEFGRNITLSFENYDFTNSDKGTVSKNLLKSTYSQGVEYRTVRYSTFYIETEHGYKLYFVVPNGDNSLKDVFTQNTISKILKKTDYGFIDHANQKLKYTRVLFPQVGVSFSGDISGNLQNDFNIKSLFDKERCDFSMLTSNTVFCNNFIHKATMNLDSKGIEGATIDLGQSDKAEAELPNYEKEYHEFVINRAFGFVLTDADGLILYVGEVNTIK